MKRTWLASLLGLSLWTAHAEEAQKLVLYPLSNASTQDIVEVVRMLTGPEGKIFYDRAGSRLGVWTTPEKQSQVAELMKELNVPPMNVKLDIVFNKVSRKSTQRASIEGDVDVKVEKDGTKTKYKIKPRVENMVSSGDGVTRQMLMVRNGGEARMMVGEEVPFAEWIVQLGRDWGYITQEFETRNVGASLVLHAQVIGTGPAIALTLTPELSNLVDGKANRIAFTRVATALTVQEGQPFTIGGLAENQEFYDRFLVGIGHQATEGSVQITGTAWIMKP
jgi:type II secretory pathway component GspD/PulD (secretin)